MADLIKPYAEALFELASESGSLDAVYQETFMILEIFRKEQGFAEMLLNPRIPPGDKESVLLKAFSGVNQDLSGIMILMLRKGRTAYIEAALNGFINMVRGHKGIVSARVYSAVALNEEQLEALKSKLALKMGKQVEIESFVDPSLIGGLLVKAGGIVLDSTIKKHLRTLKKRLA